MHMSKQGGTHTETYVVSMLMLVAVNSYLLFEFQFEHKETVQARSVVITTYILLLKLIIYTDTVSVDSLYEHKDWN